MWDTQPFGIHGLGRVLEYTASWDTRPFSTCSTRYIGYLRGLHVVESLPPNFGMGASKIRER